MCVWCTGFLLYLLDLTFRMAQWMNVSIITGCLVSKDVLALQIKFDHVNCSSFPDHLVYSIHAQC